jgi:hypothetical protein
LHDLHHAEAMRVQMRAQYRHDGLDLHVHGVPNLHAGAGVTGDKPTASSFVGERVTRGETGIWDRDHGRGVVKVACRDVTGHANGSPSGCRGLDQRRSGPALHEFIEGYQNFAGKPRRGRIGC